MALVDRSERAAVPVGGKAGEPLVREQLERDPGYAGGWAKRNGGRFHVGAIGSEARSLESVAVTLAR